MCSYTVSFKLICKQYFETWMIKLCSLLERSVSVLAEDATLNHQLLPA